MIRCSQSALIECYQNIVIACLAHGIYPETWAEGYIISLFKSKDVYDPNNYRGLTITSAIGQIFNRILNLRLD